MPAGRAALRMAFDGRDWGKQTSCRPHLERTPVFEFISNEARMTGRSGMKYERSGPDVMAMTKYHGDAMTRRYGLIKSEPTAAGKS